MTHCMFRSQLSGRSGREKNEVPWLCGAFMPALMLRPACSEQPREAAVGYLMTVGTHASTAVSKVFSATAVAPVQDTIGVD